MNNLLVSALLLAASSALANAFVVPQTSKQTAFLLRMGLFDEIKEFVGIGGQKYAEPAVMGDESIMSQKAHGTSEVPAQKDLRWGCDYETADRICNFNRHVSTGRA